MDTFENLLKAEELILAQKIKELFISLDNIKSLDKGVFNIKMSNLIMAIDIYDYRNK